MSSLNDSKNRMLKAFTRNLPTHKGNARINLDTKKIPFDETYRYEINKYSKQVKIVSDQQDNRKITTRKTNGNKVIDINNKDLTDLYKDVEMITIKIYAHEIIIEPLKELELQKDAKSALHDNTITFTDIFAGSGLLTHSMKEAGMVAKTAVEHEDIYLDNYEVNNSDTFTYSTDVSLMDYSLLPKSTVLLGGVPCDPYSNSGTKEKEDCKTGALGYFFIRAVEQIRPAVVVVEEVVPFAKSAMKSLIVSVLKTMGYKISEKILNSAKYGAIQKRERFCMVATMADEAFEFSKEYSKNRIKISDILEVPINERVWHDRHNSKTMKYSLEKEVEHIKKGDGFRLARTYIDDTSTKTITKGYYKWQLTSPILVHPNNPEKYSWFTPRELARLSGLPESFSFGALSKTRIGQIIGQGVEVNCFTQLGIDIMNHIKKYTKTNQPILEMFKEEEVGKPEVSKKFKKQSLEFHMDTVLNYF